MRYVQLTEQNAAAVHIRDDMVIVIRPDGHGSSLLVEAKGGPPLEIHVTEPPVTVIYYLTTVTAAAKARAPAKAAKRKTASRAKKAAKR